MNENIPDLSGFDPANKELDPKLFIVERCLEMVQRIEKKNLEMLECLYANNLGGAMKISMDIRHSLDYLGANGYLGRLRQHLARLSASDSEECDDNVRLEWAFDPDHQPGKVIKLISANPSELATLLNPVIRVFRLWPKHVEGFVQELSIPNTLSNIIETVGRSFGGGNYRIHVVDVNGNTLATSLFQIAGDSKSESLGQIL